MYMIPVVKLPLRCTAALTVVVAFALGCSEPPELGPKDGHDLPREDLERVQVGDLAPDFTLDTHSDGYITLSDYRGKQNVVLVFYRGHW